jgi:hypothetical protein
MTVITVATANLGRGVPIAEWRENMRRLRKVPGRNVFYGLQEIDEADAPDERGDLLREFRSTHRFAGTQTAVPILVPRSWAIHARHVHHASDGVAGLSPHRVINQAVVHPVARRDRKAVALNTHFGRDIPQLARARADADKVLRDRLEHWSGRRGLPSWLTADLNSRRYPKLAPREKRFVSAGLDVIRGYEPVPKRPRIELLDRGTINLTIDGHDLEWARLRLDWPR